MFDWLKKKFQVQHPADYVSSIDELIDGRARAIASRAELDIDAIFPLCSYVNSEITRQNRHLCVDVEESQKTQIVAQYELLLASASVLSYELTKKSSIAFPAPSSDQAKIVPKSILNQLKSFAWRANRIGSPQQYEIMGRIFEDNLNNLEASIASGRIEVDIDATYRRIYRT